MVKVKKNEVVSGSKVAEKPNTPVADISNTSSGEIVDRLQKNKNIVIGVIAALVLLVGGWVGYSYYKKTQDQEAQSLMFPAVYHFETDSLKKALNGDGLHEGLVAIADDYGMTKAGNLANFYTGVAHLKEGKYDEAINYLKDFKSSDLLVQARAYSLIGDAYMEKGQTGEAISYYEKAANYEPNEFFTPQYLSKLAIAQEANKNYEAAIQTYNKIIEQYSGSSEVTNAKKYKARLEGLAAK
jgi:tetratricopeptide (TPR) repeat protein